MNIKLSIIDPVKNFYKKHFVTQFSKQGFNKGIEGIIIYFGVLREKLGNLPDTNYKLALFHYENGNINDAIFRFNILKLFKSTKIDIDYYLGCCYFEKFKYSKSAKFFDMYKKNSSGKFLNEIEYFQNIISQKYKEVKEIPASIAEHVLNETIVKNQISEEEGLVYKDIVSEVKLTLRNHAKPFDNNIIEFGVESKYFGYYIRKDKVVNYLMATCESKKLSDLIKEDLQDDLKIYNEILYSNFNRFFESDNRYLSSKYDIIIALKAIDLTLDLDLIFRSVLKILNKNSLFVMSIIGVKSENDIEFNYKLGKFTYDKDYVIDFAKSQGYKLVNTYEFTMRGQKRLLLIFTV